MFTMVCTLTEKWSLCYHQFQHRDTNTNMLVERYNYLKYCFCTLQLTPVLPSQSFHNKLKTNPKYLNHRVNRRCDDLLQVLLRFEQDMFCDRMRKEIVMSPGNASEKNEGTKRHSSGAQIPNSSVQVTAHNIYMCMPHIS